MENGLRRVWRRLSDASASAAVLLLESVVPTAEKHVLCSRAEAPVGQAGGGGGGAELQAPLTDASPSTAGEGEGGGRRPMECNVYWHVGQDEIGSPIGGKSQRNSSNVCGTFPSKRRQKPSSRVFLAKAESCADAERALSMHRCVDGQFSESQDRSASAVGLHCVRPVISKQAARATALLRRDQGAGACVRRRLVIHQTAAIRPGAFGRSGGEGARRTAVQLVRLGDTPAAGRVAPLCVLLAAPR